MGVLEVWLIFLFIGFSFQGFSVNSQNLICNQNDMQALRGFLSGLELGIDGWEANSSSANCCNWVGVTCNSSSFLGLDDATNSGRVVKLELGAKRLSGNLSITLGNLYQLRTLNLSQNYLKGSLPLTLLQLPRLEVLDLSSNDLSGFFPTSVRLPSIRFLDISENSFQGSAPVGICNNSTEVEVMKLGANSFGGVFPSGLGNCTSLVHLCLASNILSGNLPEDMYQLPKLAELDLQDNRFSGQLSEKFGNLSNLFRLDISSNEFSGNIPDIFHGFRNLTYFSAQSNKFIGRIPVSLANSPTIAFLSLRNNSLSGTIDLNCAAMASLVSLDLATNQFHGSIPANLPACPKLKTINLARNNFTADIPESFKNFQTLSHLSLSNSSLYNLSAALTTLQHCRNLTTLVLTLNFRNEKFPSDPSLQFTALKALVIANCRLTGAIPQWLRNSRNLQLLDLSWNRLEGAIPAWFGSFQSLFYLDLSNNSFAGKIPKELTELQSLIDGNLSLKDPSPDFPFFLKRNTSAAGLRYNQILSFPPSLLLGNNLLNGTIWPEFGNLKRLHVLDLKSNFISGTIPSNLSGMTSIETLDLSHNNLSGLIPPSLTGLSFLSKFNVAYNKLSGEIPSRGQFGTFPNSSFEGNLGLCGEHGRSPCPKSNEAPNNSFRRARKPRSTIIGMAIGISLGTVFLLALMFFIILQTTSRRAIDPEKETDEMEKDLEELGSSLVVMYQSKGNTKEITLDDLLNSTNNFDQSNIIGCGGFGLVYKAVLSDGRKVAIKRLCGDSGPMEREFHAEVETLSRAQHPNLVHLQGYCRYKNDRLLIYSFMENGSLDYWLHEKIDGPSSLDWNTRLEIARGAARGLAYLHQSCEPHILHRDIKSSNILLDENFEAHLADFGLARLILPYDTHVTTDLVGTLGYIPPEYGQASVATYKGDVYSFGVVLLELLTAKRPIDMCKPKGNRDLISWVIQMRRDKRESEIFDPFIYDKKHAEEMLLVLEIAGLCLNESPKTRPSTQQLVSWLDNIHSVTGLYMLADSNSHVSP
ncbi:hypothetical protein M9H77_09191 [Catharanthus roseus]|uniref:Uncharacterized protein n=1 Tax=Catharanthus roseus TaxID=4058 RepID=A0ACC0BZY9_CATRO|nr:hypothetical protein M9H77_09191 [Catharanthus roseus]